MDRLASAIIVCSIAFFGGVRALTVSYGDLGEFEYGLGTSICHHAKPEIPSRIDTHFWLYTTDNRDTPQELVRTSSSTIQNSNFVPSRDTKLLIHGYLDSYTHNWWQSMKDALLTKDVNVIMVDWKMGARNINYAESRANTRVVGKDVCLLLHELASVGGATFSSMHIIGHSLGAHTAGYAGEACPGVGRVTGLDPAGPEFSGCETYTRLDKTDAIYVDAMHTDGADGLLPLGLLDESGHQDFYPNGGEDQPGCITRVCDHMRAVELFTESVTSSCRFAPTMECSTWASYPACQTCSNCPVMGYDANQNLGSGCYYVNTNDISPFCY